jgi:hypothetical protein
MFSVGCATLLQAFMKKDEKRRGKKLCPKAQEGRFFRYGKRDFLRFHRLIRSEANKTARARFPGGLAHRGTYLLL